MNAIPYDRPEEEWDSYQEGTEEFALPGRPRRQWFNRKSAALFALLLGAIGFYAGVRVEKSQVSNSSSHGGLPAAPRRLARGGGSRRRRAGAAPRARRRGRGATGASGRDWRCAPARRRRGPPRPVRRRRRSAWRRGGAGATFGTVSTISGNTLYITEATGNTVKVTLSSATKVTKNVTVGKKAVRPGDTVVVAGAKNSNGTVSATTVSDTGAGARSRCGLPAAGQRRFAAAAAAPPQ